MTKRQSVDLWHITAILTPGETEVMNLMAKGLTNTEIARLLKQSRPTIEHYITDMYGKLGLSINDPVHNPRVTLVLAWLDREAAKLRR